MKKLLLLTFLAIFIVACKENNKFGNEENIESQNQKNSELTFSDMDMIKSKSEDEIEIFLKRNRYSLLEAQFANQWKSELNNNIVQFNGKGVFVFLTYDLETYNKLIADLNKSKYENSGKTMKNELEVESYTKNYETILLSTMNNPENGKKVYSLTFLS